MKIGFIGAGEMGRPMVDQLRDAGHDVTVLVRRPEAKAAVEASGLDAADTVDATVREADVVFVVVLNDDQVRSVCLGSEGALRAMKPGARLVQHTTCDPMTVELIAAEGEAKAIEVLDAAARRAALLASWPASSPCGWEATKPCSSRCVHCWRPTRPRSCSSGRWETVSG